jgi:alpha-tubulin suppressor-like RCC1 family protein
MPTFNFKDNDGVDIGDKYVTKDYVMDAYPDLVPGFTSGELFTCGYNTYGFLGTGTTTNRSSPGTTAAPGASWKIVGCGNGNLLAAIKTDSTLWTWGYRALMMGDGSATGRSFPTSLSGNNWKSIGVGSGHSLAVKTDGTLWACGYNNFGQLGDGTTTNRSSFVSTSGGGTNWKQSAAQENTSAAIKSDGTLWVCGYNSFGSLGTGDTVSRSSFVTTAGGGTTWKQVSKSGLNGAAIKTDGTLWTWGANSDGRLGTNNTTSRSSPGTTVGGGTNWKQVSCGSSYMTAVKTDGTLWTWGSNSSGELGTGNTTDRSSPGTTVGGGTNWNRVNTKTFSVGAIKSDGTLWTWGANFKGQLGDGTTTGRSSPGTTAGNVTTWKDISMGTDHFGAISDQGGL